MKKTIKQLIWGVFLATNNRGHVTLIAIQNLFSSCFGARKKKTKLIKGDLFLVVFEFTK